MTDGNEKTKFSVVVPAYNAGRWIGEALRSALDQTLAPHQVIVVDDGSTDDTVSIVKSMGGGIEIIEQRNAGPSAARNRGMDLAEGGWIAFLDADDRWKPPHLETIGKAVQENPEAGLIYTDAVVMDESGRELKPKLSPDPGPDPFRSLVLKNEITTSGAAIRKSCLARTGDFAVDIKGVEDWDLWIRLARYFPVVHISEITVEYRRLESGLVHTRGVALRDDNLKVVKRAAELDPDIPEPLIKKSRANCYLESAVRFMAAQDAGTARSELGMALREDPGNFKAWILMGLSLGGRPALKAVLKVKRGMGK